MKRDKLPEAVRLVAIAAGAVAAGPLGAVGGSLIGHVSGGLLANALGAIGQATSGVLCNLTTDQLKALAWRSRAS